MLLAMNADEKFDGPIWVDQLIQWSATTPLGLAYRLESIASIAVLASLSLLSAAAYARLRKKDVLE
jgi:hypothetical protein